MTSEGEFSIRVRLTPAVRHLSRVEALYRLFQSLAADFPGKVEIVRPVTNFVWAKCERAGELFDALKRQGIIVRRMGEYLRVTAGRNHENEKAADAIRFFYTEKG